VSSEALGHPGGKRRGSQRVCMRNGENYDSLLKTFHIVRNDAAHGLCSRVPSVAWLLRFGGAGEDKAPRSISLLNNL